MTLLISRSTMVFLPGILAYVFTMSLNRCRLKRLIAQAAITETASRGF
jgi:hypothetical protein